MMRRKKLYSLMLDVTSLLIVLKNAHILCDQINEPLLTAEGYELAITELKGMCKQYNIPFPIKNTK